LLLLLLLTLLPLVMLLKNIGLDVFCDDGLTGFGMRVVLPLIHSVGAVPCALALVG